MCASLGSSADCLNSCDCRFCIAKKRQHTDTCDCIAETSVFANELKEHNFCLVSMDPGWVDTDMGGGNARRMGLDKAPTDPHFSISSMLKTIKQLSVKDSEEFVDIDGKKLD